LPREECVVEAVFGVLAILLGLELGLSPWTYGFADHRAAAIGVVAFASAGVFAGLFTINEGIDERAHRTGAPRPDVSLARALIGRRRSGARPEEQAGRPTRSGPARPGTQRGRHVTTDARAVPADVLHVDACGHRPVRGERTAGLVLRLLAGLMLGASGLLTAGMGLGLLELPRTAHLTRHPIVSASLGAVGLAVILLGVLLIDGVPRVLGSD
jgi:hypothetical protein